MKRIVKIGRKIQSVDKIREVTDGSVDVEEGKVTKSKQKVNKNGTRR